MFKFCCSALHVLALSVMRVSIVRARPPVPDVSRSIEEIMAGEVAEDAPVPQATFRGRVTAPAAGPNMRAVMHDLTRPGFQRYADRWSHELRAVDLENDGARADPSA